MNLPELTQAESLALLYLVLPSNKLHHWPRNKRTLDFLFVSLENKGLIEKKVDPKSRSPKYFITSDGQDFIRAVRSRKSFGEIRMMVYKAYREGII